MARPPLANAAGAVKRFWREAAAVPSGESWRIELDGKPVNTPGRAPLAVPTAGLAEAIADEWNAQGETVDPRAMPLTGLANAAIDRVGPERETFARSLARYGETDLVCYRADGPPRLAERQAERWDPILAWARGRFDVGLESACGAIHRPQPPGTAERLAAAAAARGPFELAGLATLVTVSGSILIGLALAERAIDLGTAWSAASLDEQWQAEQWGEDAEAARALAARRAEFESAARFLALLG